jgi:hypothetical protein
MSASAYVVSDNMKLRSMLGYTMYISWLATPQLQVNAGQCCIKKTRTTAAARHQSVHPG